MIRCDQDFEGRRLTDGRTSAGNPDAARSPPRRADPRRVKGAGERRDEPDQKAFDPAYDTLPLEHFEPLVLGTQPAVDARASVGRDGFPGNLLRPGLPCATCDECHVYPRERRLL